MKKSALFILLLSSFVTDVVANNITISNISVLNNAGNTGKIIEFDLSWENSWRVASTNNYDGAWVFFKFRDHDGKWKHLNFRNGDITVPGGTAYTYAGVGMFFYRSALGSGTFTALNIRAGVQSYPGVFDVRGFAIEMVYIPQGSFYIGDGTGSNRFHDGSTTNPYQVTGLGSTITFGSSAGQLQPGAAGTLTNSFPTGYSSFWIMKYELSQGGYRDFLNTLTYVQQASRFAISPASPVGTRFNGSLPDLTLEIASTGVNSTTPAVIGCDANNNNTFNEAADGEWKVMGNLTWMDIAAYLDWSGLRPMTEFEYEKACRGPIFPVQNEYAWGTTTIDTIDYNITNHNAANSSITNASSTEGNANFYINLNTTDTPFYRGGIFANAGSTRISAGAGYYGAMELTGNVVEFAVTIVSTAGRSFQGNHGDGELNGTGNADESTWPGINGNDNHNLANGIDDGITGVTGSAGIYIRGGAFGLGLTEAPVSWRSSSTSLFPGRQSYQGVRGVRN